ncbi:MAG: TlyA family RNA methyltransferase [Dehalococcoidia bacterium]|nr:TlyA family RNA methyltransferase [Dehalococcoidia bacterium]
MTTARDRAAAPIVAAGPRPPRAVRTRLDQALVERGLVPTRERARALVLAREVEVDGEVVLRAAAPVRADSDVRVREQQRFVSRGGEKLEGALAKTGIYPRGLRCLDVGASTGGFTDCLLQHGAAHVVAVDVGYGQLAASLREDARVTVVERTNARNLEVIDPLADLAVIDVSFISLTTVLPAVLASVRVGGDVLALVKPQFEAGREQIERGGGGVIRDPIVHASTVAEVAVWAVRHGVRVRGVVRSSLLGPKGNREFFLWLRKHDAAIGEGNETVEATS